MLMMQVKVVYPTFYSSGTPNRITESWKYLKDLISVYEKTILKKKCYFQVQVTTFSGEFHGKYHVWNILLYCY